MGSFTGVREVFTYLATGCLTPTVPLQIGSENTVTKNAQIKSPRTSILLLLARKR